VALARAIVYSPPILLMDEPLGALDKNLRENLQVEIRRIHRELGTTFLYVTHDQSEALALSDRIAIFKEGKIDQLGTTTEVYESPTTTFVATFIGESNIIRGQVNGSSLVAGPWTFALPAGTKASGKLGLLVRPEKLTLGATTGARNTLRGAVIESVYLGASRRVSLEVNGVGRLVAYEPAGSNLRVDAGTVVEVSWAIDDAVVLTDNAPTGLAAASGAEDAPYGGVDTSSMAYQQPSGPNSMVTMEDQ
jgi:putative spermidine/putrescine transport system ATP-binding protein